MIEHGHSIVAGDRQVEHGAAYGNRSGRGVDGIGRFGAVTGYEAEGPGKGIDRKLVRAATIEQIGLDLQRAARANDQSCLVVE